MVGSDKFESFGCYFNKRNMWNILLNVWIYIANFLSIKLDIQKLYYDIYIYESEMFNLVSPHVIDFTDKNIVYV